jgi:hypothetical protein
MAVLFLHLDVSEHSSRVLVVSFREPERLLQEEPSPLEDQDLMEGLRKDYQALCTLGDTRLIFDLRNICLTCDVANCLLPLLIQARGRVAVCADLQSIEVLKLLNWVALAPAAETVKQAIAALGEGANQDQPSKGFV